MRKTIKLACFIYNKLLILFDDILYDTTYITNQFTNAHR
jgi:hypothetical protein